jgi:23S rRNA (guanosine2251-2'-O)-methyltransferase
MNLICGINPVLEALASGERHFDRLLVVKGLRNRRVSEAIARASQMGIPLRFEARETLDRMSGGTPHQGLVAVVSSKPLLSLESVLQQAREPALIVVLDGVEDPRNLGAVLRTAEAAGADGVLLPERHSAGLTETVARASAGAVEHVRVARVGNLAQTLETLKQRGLWIVGLDAAGTERWDAVDLKRPVALVLGGEGRGMRRLVRERCDHVVALPLFGHVGSLNVSVVAGIALYEAVRQRGAMPSHVRPIPAGAARPHVSGYEPAAHAANVSGADGPEDHAEEPGPNVLLHEDDDSAWWGTPGAPQVIPSRARLSTPGRERHKGRRRRRHDREGPGTPPAGDRPPASGSAPPSPPGEGGGKRGRRRRRRGGPPAGGPAPGPPTGPPEAATGSAPGAGAPPRGRRRRFRRRRRGPEPG